MVPERRFEARNDAWIDAVCRIKGKAHCATLTNVSKYGSCAVMDRIAAVSGDQVVIQMSDLLIVPATVQWVRGNQTGLIFANPLIGGMLSQFARRFGSERDRLH
jgi:hypothetical protein